MKGLPSPRPFAWFAALLTIPTLMLCGACVFFAVHYVPKIITAERARLTREYRDKAEDLQQGVVQPTWRGTRAPDWRSRGKLGKRNQPRQSWGVVTLPDERSMVWVEGAEETIGLECKTLHETNYARIFEIGIPLTMAALLALTFFGLASFRRLIRERDDFLRATAHDLTTPLTGMQLLIGRSDDDARILAERMMRLVNNLKDFLRMGGRRTEPKCETFSLQHAYDEAYRLFADDFEEEKSGAVMRAECEEVQVRADETLTIQVLWNLLGNDLKYAAPFGTIKASFRKAGAFTEFVLEDSGPGMSAYARRHAFDRYYRAKTVFVTGKGGFGIGLCTGREFARAMGGELTVTANEAGGSTFSLKLPAAI